MMHQQEAHARRTDPRTSHEAARAVTIGLTSIQRLVLAFAARHGSAGFTDIALQDFMRDHGATHRTRRHELTELGLIRDSGRVARIEGELRRRIIWVVTAKGIVRNGSR